MTISRLALAALAAIATIAAGCGDDANNADSGAAASQKQQSRPPTVPAELLGRYTTTLQRADIPKSPPPELTDGSPTWKLTIAKSGGIDNGPALTIANAQLGVLETSNFVAQESTVLLEHEECAAAGGESSYNNSNATPSPATRCASRRSPTAARTKWPRRSSPAAPGSDHAERNPHGTGNRRPDCRPIGYLSATRPRWAASANGSVSRVADGHPSPRPPRWSNAGSGQLDAGEATAASLRAGVSTCSELTPALDDLRARRADWHERP